MAASVIYLQKIEKGDLVGWAGSNEEDLIVLRLQLEGYVLGSVQLDLNRAAFPETREGVRGGWFSFALDGRMILALAYRHVIQTFHFQAEAQKDSDNRAFLEIDRSSLLAMLDLSSLCTREDFLFLLPHLSELALIGHSFSDKEIVNLLEWSLLYQMTRYFPESWKWLLASFLKLPSQSRAGQRNLWKRLCRDSRILLWLWEYRNVGDEENFHRIVRCVSHRILIDRYERARIPFSGRVECEALRDVVERDDWSADVLNESGVVERLKGVEFLAEEAWSELSRWVKSSGLFPEDIHESIVELRRLASERASVELQWLLCRIFWDPAIEEQLREQIASELMERRTLSKPWPRGELLGRIWNHAAKNFSSLERNFHYLYEAYREGELSLRDLSPIAMDYLSWLYRRGIPRFRDQYLYLMQQHLFDREFLLPFTNEPTPLSRQMCAELCYWEALRREAMESKEKTPLSMSRFLQLQILERDFLEAVSLEGFALTMNLWNRARSREEKEALWPFVLKYGGNYEKYRCGVELDKKEGCDLWESRLTDPDGSDSGETGSIRRWLLRILRSRQSPLENRMEDFQSLWREIELRIEEGREMQPLLAAIPGELLLMMEEGIGLERLFPRSRETIYEEPIFSMDATTAYRFSLLKEWESLRDALNLKDLSRRSWIRQKLVFPHTMVLIYSCQANRETRQQQIWESWLQRLKELGIEYRFVMGGVERSREEGDLLLLAVEDSYEALPKKSLAMFREAYRRFGQDYFLKIDDDCLLNVDAYFSDPRFLRTDYYGRTLARDPGTMNRAWHQGKSSSSQANHMVDLSPEPSRYADGSTGYLLSRRACEALEAAQEDSRTQALRLVSFMEDKLVGDLLASREIFPSSEGYFTLIQRKITSDLQATFWEYNLFPRKDNGVKCYHSELSQDLQWAWKQWQDECAECKAPLYLSEKPIDRLGMWRTRRQAMIEFLHRGKAIEEVEKIIVYRSSCWREKMVEKALLGIKDTISDEIHSLFLIELNERSSSMIGKIGWKDMGENADRFSCCIRIWSSSDRHISSKFLLKMHYGIAKKLEFRLWDETEQLWSVDKSE